MKSYLSISPFLEAWKLKDGGGRRREKGGIVESRRMKEEVETEIKALCFTMFMEAQKWSMKKERKGGASWNWELLVQRHFQGKIKQITLSLKNFKDKYVFLLNFCGRALLSTFGNSKKK